MNFSAWKRYTEFWYSGYALQGIIVYGTGPILIPIIVGNVSNAANPDIARVRL
jgi:hypothetical protein